MDFDLLTTATSSPHQLQPSLIKDNPQSTFNSCFTHRGGSVRTFKVPKAMTVKMGADR